MTQADTTLTPWTPAQFLTPENLAKLSKNQQTHAQMILTDFIADYQEVAATDQTWTVTGLKAALTALPMMVDRSHNYFVAVIPVLTAYLQAQITADFAPYQAALTAARSEMVAKHTTETVDQEQRDYENIVATIESWVQTMAAQPQVANLSANDQQNFGLIVHVTAELLMTGKHEFPNEWDADSLAAVMFGPFTHLLDEGQRTDDLYRLIPFALTMLFNFLRDQGALEDDQAKALQGWVRERHTALTTMYDPKMEDFFQKLTQAMQRAGVDTQDHDAVDRFTQQYLHQNPTQGQELFATDQQLKATNQRRGNRPSFRRKRRK